MSKKYLVEITINEKNTVKAQFEDNKTTRKLISRMPFSIDMDNLYSREMCYRYGRGGLPIDNVKNSNYQIGDISYWPPMGSLVILYEQNGEIFEQQSIGHIDADVSFFNKIKSARVTFELKD